MPTDPAALRPPKDLPAVIGPYRVANELGRGRLGPLVLATHRPTGDRVALRVLKPEWACLPKFVSRLTRSAFAAAQVEHPNLVRVLDFGGTQGRVYFATEYVDGPSLADVVKNQGALTPPRAVAHVLQAARGLRFAHGQGISHGDVRPESLFVDPDGLTRLADLGLTTTPAMIDADEAREARGPIAASAEAQAEADAAPFLLDVRALGRTLTFLLTGKAATHPTALLSAGLPMNLVELVRNLVDPNPSGTFRDLGQVVPALERFLNSRGGPATAPGEPDSAVLNECARSFLAAPSALLRRRIGLGAFVAIAVVVALGLIARRPLFAASVAALGLMSAAADFVVSGFMRKTTLFGKLRGLVLESRGGDWLIGLGAFVVLASGLYAMNLHGAWIAFGILAVIVAAWLHVAVDGKTEAERRGSVEEARALAKAMRLRGVDEETLRRFVRASAGVGSEGDAFFEALFGFEALRTSREPSERGWMAPIRNRSFPWREALASWVDARQAARRRERDWTLLQAIEERGLEAEGVNLVTARRKARRIAGALLAVAAEIRAAAHAPAGTVANTRVLPPLAKALRDAADAPEVALVEHERGDTSADLTWVRDLLIGPRTRFLVGSLILAGFLIWAHQNQVISETQLGDVAARALDAPDPLHALRESRIDIRLDGANRPLRLAFVPGPVASLFNGVHAGVAGLILVVSSLVGGSRVGYFAAPGAAVALLGPSMGVPQPAAMAVGAGVSALGLFFGKSHED